MELKELYEECLKKWEGVRDLEEWHEKEELIGAQCIFCDDSETRGDIFSIDCRFCLIDHNICDIRTTNNLWSAIIGALDYEDYDLVDELVNEMIKVLKEKINEN